ncbi:MAG: Error-prone repair protein ImuA, partial [Cyclobacteriaceae bacterium]
SVGFLSGLLSSLIGNNKAGVWISSQRSVFPPALKTFGLEPDRVLFVDLPREKDVQWAMEEALKCSAITVAVAEMRDISFTASRRLQLAVEESKVTGFILRTNSKKPTTTACVSRWRITPLPSETLGDLPGMGFPRWKVELLRIRNGRPGSWNVEWRGDRFAIIDIDLHSSLNNPLLIKAG